MVNLYQRKIYRDGKHIKTSLYFDYYLKGQGRARRFINHYLLIGKQYKRENKKTLEIVNALLIQENNKLQATKSISKCIEREKHVTLLSYIAGIIQDQKKYSLYSNLYSNLKLYLKRDIRLKDIDYKWLESWKQSLIRSKSLSVNSARAYYLKLNTVLNRAVREGLINDSPAKRIETIKSQSVKRDYLTLEELKQIAALPGEKYEMIKRAFLFACFTGLRRSSICNLLYSEIKDNQIQRRDEKTGDYEYFDLSATAKQILDTGNNLLNSTGRVFEGIFYYSMVRDLKAFLKPLKIDKHITFHTARRTYATMLLTQGANLYTVSKLLGHSDIKTTQIYANIINDVKRDAVNALPVLEIK